MHDFVLALIGGALIGLAAVLLLLSHGKILGVSGIISRLLPPVSPDAAWRIAFLAGVLASPWIYLAVNGSPATIVVRSGPLVLILGGLLVGFGTVKGAGCTSGHGVCGVSRISTRSMAATGTFMATGFATVFVIRHVIG